MPTVLPVEARAGSHRRLMLPMVGDGQNTVAVSLPVPIERLPAFPVSARVWVEQSVDGREWLPLVSAYWADLRAALLAGDRAGAAAPALTLTVAEQWQAAPRVRTQRWAVSQTAEDGWLQQLALHPLIGVSLDVYAADSGVLLPGLTFGLDAAVRFQRWRVPYGRPPASASLVGTFTGAHISATSSVTTSSRTTTTGNLLTGHGATWTGGSPNGNLAWSDNKSNVWSEQEDLSVDASIRLGLAYMANAAGGAGHTVTLSNSGGLTYNLSVSAAEWSGLDTAPTVVSSSGTGTSTTPSASASAGSASLYVGVCTYTASATTIAEDSGGGWSLIQEIDESSVDQAHNAEYKVSLSGSNAANWTLGASRTWGAAVMAISESGGAARSWILGSH